MQAEIDIEFQAYMAYILNISFWKFCAHLCLLRNYLSGAVLIACASISFILKVIMITVTSRLLTLTVLLSAVAGCTYQSPTRFNPTYIMSDTSMPSAQLHIQSFPVSLGMYEDSGLEREEVSCGVDGKSHSSYTQLSGFENRGRGRAYPPVATVTLPSGPAYFVLTENTDSVTCRVPFSANLEAGGSYEISASVVHVSFMEGRSCVPEIVDKNSGQKIPVLAKLNRPYPQPHVGSCPNDAKNIKE